MVVPFILVPKSDSIIKGITSDEGYFKVTCNILYISIKIKLITRESTKLDAVPYIFWYSLPTKYKGGGNDLKSVKTQPGGINFKKTPYFAKQ